LIKKLLDIIIPFIGGQNKMKKLNRKEFLKQSGTISMGMVLGNTPSIDLSRIQISQNRADPWLEINLKNISWNLSQIRKKAFPRPVMGVIKANAYGHGLVEVAKSLENQKIGFLAVGNLWEAITLRKNGIVTPILNFGPMVAGDSGQIVQKGISQSVYSEDVVYLSQAANKHGEKAKVHIKVDTGLGRVGIPYYQALAYIKKVAALANIKIEGIFTTFTEDKNFDKVQLQRFLQICKTAKREGINVGLRHAVSSAGILSFSQGYLDMVRPGIMIYGHYPSTQEYQNRQIDLRPAMTLKARIIQVKDLRPGDSISYHRKFIAKQKTPVATLPVGYSDGYLPTIVEKGEVVIKGQRWPLIAAITSNHSSVNITGDKSIKKGDPVVLMGKQGEGEVNAEEIAQWAKTSVYKIVINMNPLLPRRFIE
jgi:alanine racemase